MTPQAKIEILQHLIQIPSVNAHEADVADYLASLFAPYPQAQVERLTYAPGRDNLVVTIGNMTGPRLGLSGHMDVVAPGDESAWTRAPFGGEVVGDQLFGRGASDMKSGLAAIVITMLEFLEQGTPLAGSVRLLATVGEETGEYGAAQLTDAGYADHLAGLVIAEPSGLDQVVYTARGVIDYKVVSTGKGVHSASPELGINAITNLMKFYNAVGPLMAQHTKTDPVLGGLLHNVDLISGGEQINSIPAHAELMANMRTIPAYPNQVIYDELEGLVAQLNQEPGVQLDLSYSFPEEAIPGNPNAPLVQLAKQISDQVCGHDTKVVGSGGANDGAEFLRAKGDFTSIEIGPGSNTSHQPDEYIAIQDYLQAIDFYEALVPAFFAAQTKVHA
ncbi:succinyl-diaminopimelate desuccinylase [Levilactobacillus zymae]|uniref:Probable succinyl-diaminopimelate desuccinylase n=1 Tax=Levilactobacillus zymae TaxID=267363 RepID=A0ABQ0WXF3_9LACO|nr:ArgE/DapE family deacylase [Levilactobacillus zymae]KRL11773.1 acetylornithine deacetylase succinyl-diaminopimelate desuccinylase-like protein [Levilactobacillus zymae DSM 19395]QFR62191.1 ArgE/DapE family deacylase [Levilactobacillus zymae]GEO72559.1 succinyl-diaminopimelate desuccinylase [Levilactobacillus zymae]